MPSDGRQAVGLPQKTIVEEMEARGLKATGFPSDDMRLLQAAFDAEWETERAAQIANAAIIEAQRRDDAGALKRAQFQERQKREEEEALVRDATAAHFYALVVDDATPPTLALRGIAPAAARAIIKAAASNSGSLRALDLTGCNLTDEAVGSALGALLSANTPLARLELDYNALGPATASALGAGLALNTHLLSLSLEHNPLVGNLGVATSGVGGEATGAIGDSIGLSDTEEVSEGEGASPAGRRGSGSVAIAPYVAPPETSGFVSLAAAVGAHPALVSLNVFGVGLSLVGGAALADACEVNPRLLSLQVSPHDGAAHSDLSRAAAAIARNARMKRDAEEAAQREVVEAAAAGAAAARVAAAEAAAMAKELWVKGEAHARLTARVARDMADKKAEIAAATERMAREKERMQRLAELRMEREAKAAAKAGKPVKKR